MNNEFDNTTGGQILAMLRAGLLTGEPVTGEERVERLTVALR